MIDTSSSSCYSISHRKFKSMNSNSPFYHILKNMRIFTEFQRYGYDYIVNPKSGELHKALGGEISGSHNLAVANLEDFFELVNRFIPIHWNLHHLDGLVNVGLVNLPLPIDSYHNDTLVPVTGELIGEYSLNKCKHCFPH